jgi:hypothetical protein
VGDEAGAGVIGQFSPVGGKLGSVRAQGLLGSNVPDYGVSRSDWSAVRARTKTSKVCRQPTPMGPTVGLRVQHVQALATAKRNVAGPPTVAVAPGMKCSPRKDRHLLGPGLL